MTGVGAIAIEDLANRLRVETSGDVRLKEPMSAHTTFGLGGPADLFVAVRSQSDLDALLELCRGGAVPVTPIGDGSNLLVSDRGVRGAVVKLAGDFDRLAIEDSVLEVGAGASLGRAISEAAAAGCAGLEVVYGVPGSVGGGVYMNAGTRNGWISDVLLAAELLDHHGTRRWVTRGKMGMSYRHSCLQDLEPPAFVTRAKFGLKPEEPARIRQRIAAYASGRKESQPLQWRSCGCMFRNPEGDSAGRLIDAAGLKGHSAGGAQISEKHANFFVNTGGATASDVYALVKTAKSRVLEYSGVELVLEVKLLGEWPDD